MERKNQKCKLKQYMKYGTGTLGGEKDGDKCSKRWNVTFQRVSNTGRYLVQFLGAFFFRCMNRIIVFSHMNKPIIILSEKGINIYQNLIVCCKFIFKSSCLFFVKKLIFPKHRSVNVAGWFFVFSIMNIIYNWLG